MPNALQAISVLIPLVLGGLTYLGGREAARRAAEASPYAVLAERVVALEKRDAERDAREAQMHRDQLIDRDCIRQLVMLFENRFPGETLGIRLPGWYSQTPLDSTDPNPKD